MQQKHLDFIVKLRHELHECPELSLEEHKTKETLMNFLKINTNLEVVNRGKWFYAFYQCNKPDSEALAFRADFDALPIPESIELTYASKKTGVSHKCGHDGHSAALAGLALEINESGADHDIYFIFQHGEEIGMGGKLCADLITEKKIRRIFAFHNMSGYPLGSVIAKEGVTHCASKGLTIHLTGTPTHASLPEEGKNPSAAIAQIALEIHRIASSDGYDGMVLATIVHMETGSKNFGIAASDGEISITLRGEYERDMRKLEDLIRQYAKALAAKEKLKIDFIENDIFPETINEEKSVKMVQQAAQNNGSLFLSMPAPFRASEDFGYYLKKCPGAIFYVGNGETYPQLHTLEYDFNDLILEVVVDIFKELVII